MASSSDVLNVTADDNPGPVRTSVSSKMRRHGGNIPSLPQTKECPYCDAKYTRSTHLNRHIKTHTKQGMHPCPACGTEFTRSDLLTRHKKTCGGRPAAGASRRKSCKSCADSKTKCDLKEPCTRCATRNRECIYPSSAPSKALLPPHTLRLPSCLQIFAGRDKHDLRETLSSITPTPSVDASTSTLSSPPETEAAGPAAVGGAPGALFSGNMFDDLFSNVFAASAASGHAPEEDGLALLAEAAVTLPEDDFALLLPMMPPASFHGLSRPCHVPNAPETIQELDHYEYLFFAEFVPQMPIVHPHTFSLQNKPPIVIETVRACGALYVKTNKATEFVRNTLVWARETLAQEFTRSLSDEERINLVMAVSLLQTIGLFHQRSDERAISNLFHGMLVMMVRRHHMIQRNAEWTSPFQPGMQDNEECWREWAKHETAKRSLLLSYLHDTCHRIYFALPSSYRTSEFTLRLPCDNRLWSARSASEWMGLMNGPSGFGTGLERCLGVPMGVALGSIRMTRPLDPVPALSPMGQFVLIHAILSDLYAICTPIESQGPASAEEGPRDVYAFQYALHNWLSTWLAGPETPAEAAGADEPPFYANCLPFYWLGQITLMAYQEGMPPFQPGSASGTDVEARFRLVKQWLRHIREFLRSQGSAAAARVGGGAGGNAPTLFWDEMMKIRLDSWQIEVDTQKGSDHDGLLGFFPILGEADWDRNPV